MGRKRLQRKPIDVQFRFHTNDEAGSSKYFTHDAVLGKLDFLIRRGKFLKVKHVAACSLWELILDKLKHSIKTGMYQTTHMVYEELLMYQVFHDEVDDVASRAKAV